MIQKYVRRRGDALVPMNAPLSAGATSGIQNQAPCGYTVLTGLAEDWNAGTGRDAGIRAMWVIFIGQHPQYNAHVRWAQRFLRES